MRGDKNKLLLLPEYPLLASQVMRAYDSTHYFASNYFVEAAMAKSAGNCLSFDSVLGTSWRASAKSEAVQELLLSHNALTSKLERSPEVLRFFDAIRFDLFVTQLPICFWVNAYQRMLRAVQPSSIAAIADNSLHTRTLVIAARKMGILLKLLPPPRGYSFAQKILRTLPYLGWETKSAASLLRIVGKIPSGAALQKHNQQTLAQLDSKKPLTVIGVFSHRSSLREFREHCLSLQKSGSQILAITCPYDLHFRFFVENRIPYLFLAEAKKFLSSMVSTLQETADLPDLELLEALYPTGLLHYYASLFESSKTLAETLQHNIAALELCVGFSALSRLFANQLPTDIPTTLYPGISSQLILDGLFRDSTITYTCTLPSTLVVENSKVTASVNHLRSKEGMTPAVTVEPLTRNLLQAASGVRTSPSLPPGSQYFLFTTQQHTHSFSYVHAVSQVFNQFCKEHHRPDLFLIVRVHPVEFAWMYRLLGGICSHPQTRISAAGHFPELCAGARGLITNFSFTAIEAAFYRKPVIFVDFDPHLSRCDLQAFSAQQYCASNPAELLNNLETLLAESVEEATQVAQLC